MENRAAKIHILQPKDDDRISVLPEPILHHILCSLSQKEAIKTCVLSKAWRYLGRTRPKIDFDVYDSDDDSALVRILQGYHDRNLRLDEFSLSLLDDNDNDNDNDNDDDDDNDKGEATAALLNKWIPIIIQSMRVKSFDLSFNNSTPHVKLPSLILESHHIQNLILSGGMFESSTRVDLKHLQRLDLHNVYIPEEILDDVLSSSRPFVQNVSISYCKGFTRIKLLSYNPMNLTHFCYSGHGDEHHHAVSIEIGNGIQTLKSIVLTNCLLSVSHPKPLLSGSFSCNLTGLDLSHVYIPEEILDDVLSSSRPFIQNVSISYCKGFTRIKLLSYNPTNLTRFSFSGDGDGYEYHQVGIEIGKGIQTLKSIELINCLLSVSHPEPSFSCNLTRLDMFHVYIPEQLLGDVLSNCTFIEKLSLLHCDGFARIKLLKNDNPTNVADFVFQGFQKGDVSVEIRDDMQTLRSIAIECCLFSVSRNKPLEYVSLTQLILTRVQLSSESLSCNLHSLEELKLDQCSGIREFNLSSRSMKHLSIRNILQPFKATIDAPSIVSFDYEGILPQSISFATINSSDDLWESEITLRSHHEPSFDELYGLLKAVSQSEIDLELDQIDIHRFGTQLHIVGGVSEEAKHELPVAVEHLRIQSLVGEAPFSAAAFLNMMFHMFRPSFIYMDMSTNSTEKHSRKIAELLFKERETSAQSSFWQHVLEGVCLQVKYRWKKNEWQPVQYTSLSFADLSYRCATRGDLRLRIHLKWRD